MRRFFDAAVSDGTITRWLPAAQGEPALWHMTHEDGDQEDLEAHEVRAAMRAYKLGLQHDDGADGEGAEGASAMEDEDEEVEVADTSADGDVEHVLAEQEAPACLSAVAQFAGVSAVRAHLSALNGLGSSALSHFSLDEDTVTFKVRTSFVRGTVSVLLFESSSYPRTGGLAYVEGCDELLQAVESIAEPLSDRASLDNCVRLLCRALGGPPELSELLARLPASGGSGGGASCSGAAGSSSLMMVQDDDDASPMDVGDDVGGNDDDEHVSDGADDDDDDDDYDFARGAELENSLLRLRHQWEVKDQRRREERAERAREEEEAAAATAVTGSSASVAQKRKRPGPEGKAKGPQKQGAHQIFSAAEATRMLCNELFDLMKEQREGFTGVSADCVDFDIHAWRVAISDIKEGSPLQADLERLSRETGQPAALDVAQALPVFAVLMQQLGGKVDHDQQAEAQHQAELPSHSVCSC